MTREEALNKIGELVIYARSQGWDEDYTEAFDTLSAESYEDCRTCNKWFECECGEKGHKNGTSIGYSTGECKDYKPCDDCISRQAMRIEVEEWITCGEYKYSNATKYLFDRIDKLQPVTPPSKVGKWIKYSFPRCGEQHYKCTACGYYINFGQWGEFYTKEFRYCPHCRAKMVENEVQE